MRPHVVLSALLIVMCCGALHAQAPFNTKDSVSINKICAQLLVHGDMWWDPVTQTPQCSFPAHGRKHIGFVSAIWMSGYDRGGNIHVAAQTYRQDGNDYWPGPINMDDSIDYATSRKWAKIWKLDRNDIQHFLSLSTHDTINTHPNILTWPASGNSYARGNAGAPLTIPSGRQLAPFIDLNANGIYEPLLGEYPDIKGDQALWYVFNDRGPAHSQTNARPLGVEVQTMAFAYNRGSLIDQVIYYEYKITNKSSFSYLNFRLAQHADMDLGYYKDDYLGFDSSHRMAIVYNGDANDGASGGLPANSYGFNAPVVGVTMVVMPGDSAGYHAPAGSFSYFRNDMSNIGNPRTASDFDGYIRSKLRDGSPYTNDFAGRGVVSNAYGSGPTVNYVYTGNPSDTTQWSECAAGNPLDDRRFVISSSDFILASGATQKVVMALVTTDTNQGGCPNVDFRNIKIVADTAWNIYSNPLPVQVAPEPVLGAVHSLTLYPNPATQQLTISPIAEGTTLSCYNALGQKLELPTTQSNNQMHLNTSNLPTGMYYLLYHTSTHTESYKFMVKGW